MIGPESVLPVKGSAPFCAGATVMSDVGDVEPRTAVTGEIVVVAGLVDPSVTIGVLATVVDDGMVVEDGIVVDVATVELV